MKKVVSLVMAVAIALSLVGCGQQNKEATKVRFTMPKNMWFGMAMIADSKGFFAEENLNVEVNFQESGRYCIDALVSNSVDLGMFTESNLANFGYSGDTSISYIASAVRGTSSGIAARKSAGINEPKDLSGKSFAISPGTTSETFAKRFLAKNNITDVKTEKIQPAAITGAITSKSVDSASSWDPFLYNMQKAMGDDVVVFRDSDAYTGYALLAVRNDFAQNNKQAVVRFTKALKKAEEFAKTNKDEAQQIIATTINLDLEIVKATWDLYEYKLELGQAQKNEIAKQGEEYQQSEEHKGQPIPDYSVYYNDEFMKQVK